ncbi:histamine H2 receptor-like [Saccoglossus kowalevskii]|uniref:5-hydroxytryptamine receptor 1A-like n=1 Tax=Saccoglossus kowalevskii TaxID=10224 RepID=A0ABM0M9E1_SACKO|nr:PREDICTED: 5-hydroxytryptamine receptor 1A-like [Saccoglossus kowalevskii]
MAANGTDCDPNNPTTDLEQAAIHWLILQGIITFFVVMNNVIVILAFAVFPKIRSSQANVFIFNMSLTDLLLGILALPFAVLYKWNGKWTLGFTFCSLYQGTLIVFVHTSILSAMFLCLDKYLFIKIPLHYYTTVTPRRIGVAIAVTWMIPMLFGVAPSLTRINEYTSMREAQLFPLCFAPLWHYILFGACLNVIPFGIILYSNCYIFKILRNQIRRTRLSTRNDLNDFENEDGQKSRFLQPGEIKVIKTMVLITIVFLCLWTPFFVSLLANSLCSCLSPDVLEISLWLGFSNSAINPLLYAYKKDFRHAYASIYRCRLKVVATEENNCSLTATERPNVVVAWQNSRCA